MKIKRSRFTSIFFLVSFFISVSTNICLASFLLPQKTNLTQTKDHLHFNEGILKININDILFEENENEDENEFETDFSLTLIPFYRESFSQIISQDLFNDLSVYVIPAEQPIYIQFSNFRI